ncbi:MAG: carbohydrate ABC transporter permease [Clostridia bacterium]|nr:carbohydrate ABC transporter permease [Clostridia bacterium]
MLTEGEVAKPRLQNDSLFGGLMGSLSENATAEEDARPAYDTQKGSLVYDEASAPVLQSPTLRNYVNAFTNQNVNIANGYQNSLMISGSVMLIVMLLSTMMAFALTRFHFRGKGLIRSLIVAALMFPAFSTIVPCYRMLAGAGLFDTQLGVILVQGAGNLAFACTVMLGYVATLPYELEEAAFMEGAGAYRTFFRIVLPMSRPALATVAIFTFIWSYNDLFVQMVLLRSKSRMPVCAILREISSQYGTDFGLMAAAVTIVVLPVLVLYMFLQKNIIKGLTAGAVKG